MNMKLFTICEYYKYISGKKVSLKNIHNDVSQSEYNTLVIL